MSGQEEQLTELLLTLKVSANNNYTYQLITRLPENNTRTSTRYPRVHTTDCICTYRSDGKNECCRRPSLAGMLYSPFPPGNRQIDEPAIPENAHGLFSIDPATAECRPIDGACHPACFCSPTSPPAVPYTNATVPNAAARAITYAYPSSLSQWTWAGSAAKFRLWSAHPIWYARRIRHAAASPHRW